MASTLVATTSQTVGPYLHIGLAPRNCADVAFDGRIDQPNRIVIEGHAFDGDGKPLPDGMIEIWQADATGRYDHAHDPRSGATKETRSASGFGRLPTNIDGSFTFTTVKPGRVPAPDGSLQAPHIVLACCARGLLKHLSTRIYFDDEADANAGDYVLG
ncbi:MAG: protocatechuate 3,4-dioxygenase subunit alpha, partial [Burkholderiaceae bacterium]